MDLMTAKEVAEMLRVSTAHIRTLTKNGKLPFHGFRVGTAYRFSRAEVEAFIKGDKGE